MLLLKDSQALMSLEICLLGLLRVTGGFLKVVLPILVLMKTEIHCLLMTRKQIF